MMTWLLSHSHRHYALREEEERLTPYQSQETSPSSELTPPNQPATTPQRQDRVVKAASLSGWEFKIVRAKHNIFRDPAVFQQLCEEEAQAGWVLLEKFDDHRVRFKRPIALREIINPEGLPFDPYRTSYSSTGDGARVGIAIAFLLALIVPAYFGYRLVGKTLEANQEHAPASSSSAVPSPSPSIGLPPLDQLPALNKRQVPPDAPLFDKSNAPHSQENPSSTSQEGL
jgi:hypothetical protein